MNIITNYQAREIAVQNKKRRQEETYRSIEKAYEKGGHVKTVMDAIFQDINTEAEKGEFVSVVDVKVNFGDEINLRDEFGKILVDVLEHIGYSASYGVSNNILTIWTEFYERQN